MRKKNQSTEFIKLCISKALVDLMYIEKFENITVSDICKKAGVGRTTYYRYFNNRKEDLIRYIGIFRWQEYKKTHEINEKNETDELFNHIFVYKKFFLCLKEQNLVELIYKMLFDILGPLPEQTDLLSYGKSFFIGGYFGIIYQWIQNNCIETIEEIRKKLQNGFLFAIMEEKKKEDQKNKSSL